ncbi:MAG TPA: pyridoxal 5'-phosphate synthase glutaminase subunit PdxT [Myxococcales bacterium]|nr:pyridoxal 5'-phosphate synthase glutaminase subunit PdxT [Myxococcales bacterium]
MIGVLALQGGVAPHLATLKAIGLSAAPVRTAEELLRVDGLVLPGGESGAQLRLLSRHGLEGPLRALVASGKPVLATCAGLILLARKVSRPEQWSLGVLDVDVERNAYGRQLESFEATANGMRMVLIRAPRIVRAGAVEVLARLDGEPVLVRQRNVFGATFHPELAGETAVHRMAFA